MTTIRSQRSLVLATPLLCLVSGVCAQDPTPPKPPDKEVAEKVALLDQIGDDKKFARDAEGIEIIDVLYQKHEAGLNEKDQQLIVKALDALLNKQPRRPFNQIKIYSAAANALSQQGAEGAKVLKKAYESKRFPDKPDWVPLREQLLLAIGKAKDESTVKFLVEEASRSPESALQAAAGEALGNFDQSKEKLRKEIVRELLTKYGSLAETASQLGTNIEAGNAQDRLDALSGKWNNTLKKLTGQNFDTFREWQAWHNDNKNKPW